MNASFEHGSMKSSFSLSSLGTPASPPGARYDQNERPYHSLTKKRKEPSREAWRRSWGSAASGGSAVDDLWPLLQHHYDYIMDNQIIDTCKEANGELLLHNSSGLQGGPRLLNPNAGFNRQWSLSQLTAEFAELCQWLTQIQDEIYATPENLASKELRTMRMTELLSAESRRAKFMEQANAILDRIPEAAAEVSWRIEHLNVKWEGLRLLLSPDQQPPNGETVDTNHELRCLRRWLHTMEGRLPPPSINAARAAHPTLLRRKLQAHKVLQRDVECHGRIVSSVVRLSGGCDAARALERRWHLLYLRAIEWQCHLEACLAKCDQSETPADVASDSDDEPVLKQPRLSSRGSPRRQRTPVNVRRRESSTDSRQSASEEEQEYVLTYNWRGFGSDCESELVRISRQDSNMEDERRVPAVCELSDLPSDQIVPHSVDQFDGPGKYNTLESIEQSKFNQSVRKSKRIAIFYSKHLDTDSDRQIVDDDKYQEDSSEEEWLYTKIANEDSTDLMTSSIEIQSQAHDTDKPESPKLKLESSTPDLLKDQNTRCKDIERLVIEAEELVQKKTHQKMVKTKNSRSVKPLIFEDDNNASRAKMSRIKEWINQSSKDNTNDSNQGTESYDASGEYTTESEVDTSLTSEERNIHSSMDMSTSTITPTHHAKGHISSTNTMTEACTSCVEASDKQYWLRKKKLKIRRSNRERLVKSFSFSGRLTPEIEDKNERSTVSDPATSRKGRDTTSASGNDSDEDKHHTIAHLRKSIEKTHISTNTDATIPEQSDQELPAPSFKLGPAGGVVRSRLARSIERERSFLALSLGEQGDMWDASVDKDSDVDKSGTAGTEEHSSFSEQAWDFFQEKYHSEPYSEAPDSDAARRLLEFGDDYRAFIDSQSDCCSSLSAQPEVDSPGGRRRPSDCREKSLPKYKRPTRTSPDETPTRKPKKSMSSAERKKNLLDSLERSRNNTSLDSNDSRRRKQSENERKNNKRSPEFDLVNVRRRHSSNITSDEVNSSLEYTEVNRPDIIDSLNRRRRNDNNELQKVALSELRRGSTECIESDDESPKKHSRRWKDSDSESEEIRGLVKRSSNQLEAAESMMARHDSSPDLLRAFDYTEIISRCRDNINLLDAALTGMTLSSTMQRDIRAVSARWSALRAAATRRSSCRRLRREIAALRETIKDVCEPDDCAPQPHTRAQLNRRIDELKERLFRLLECKVSMLKLSVSVRRAIGELDVDDHGLGADLATLLEEGDNAQKRTSNELLSLEKAVCAWAEWESALRELQGALRGDLATLQSLQNRTGVTDQGEVAAQIRQLAASLVDKKKGSSTCDSLSDSGISDGDSEGAGGRARRLCVLRELAARLQAVLAPNSPALRGIAKRMEQTETEVRVLQESCRALVEQSIPDLAMEDDKQQMPTISQKTGSGDPDFTPRGGWLRRVLRSSLPIQLCLVALLLAAWLVERPRCCDALNSLAQTLTPQLRYVRGPPPV